MRFGPSRFHTAMVLSAFILLILSSPVPSETDLSIYNDSFDALGMDFWEDAQYTFNESQLDNFKLGDKDIVDGRLVISTKPGGFSKAGLSARYKLHGDFDIQVDCRVDFDASNRGMDHVVSFAAGHRGTGKSFNSTEWGIIRLEKRARKRAPRIVFMHVQAFTPKVYRHKEIDSFSGSIRLVRKGRKMTGYYRPEGTNSWRVLGSASWFPKGDATLGIVVQNFQARRTKIEADKSVSATFDNYRINHADEVIEDEI